MLLLLLVLYRKGGKAENHRTSKVGTMKQHRYLACFDYSFVCLFSIVLLLLSVTLVITANLGNKRLSPLSGRDLSCTWHVSFFHLSNLNVTFYCKLEFQCCNLFFFSSHLLLVICVLLSVTQKCQCMWIREFEHAKSVKLLIWSLLHSKARLYSGFDTVQ